MNIHIVGQPDLLTCGIIDHNVVPFVRRCMSNGLGLDKPHFAELSKYLDYKIAETSIEIAEYIPKDRLDAFTEESLSIDDFNPDSPDQIGTLLFKHLNIGAGKELLTTKSGNRLSTGKNQLGRLRQDHPIIPIILQRREYKKLSTTYAKRLPELSIWSDELQQWRLYYNIGLTFASTGRMTCSRLHQIPFKTDLGQLVRMGLKPRPGKHFISIDFSQIELRILAHVAREQRMMEIFFEDGDIHQVTQDNLPMPDVLTERHKRTAAKSINFSIVYGVTDLGMWLAMEANGIPVTREQCAALINGWYKTYPDVLPYAQQQHYRARRYGMVWTLFGRVSPVPEVKSVHRRIVQEGLRRAQNYPVQGAAGDIFKIAAAQVNDFCMEVRAGLFGRPHHLEPLLPIHDQILMECDPEIAEDVAEEVSAIMSSCVDGLRVPLKVDWSIQPDCWIK